MCASTGKMNRKDTHYVYITYHSNGLYTEKKIPQITGISNIRRLKQHIDWEKNTTISEEEKETIREAKK